MSASIRNRRGLTLVEVLATMILLSLTVMIGGAALESIVDGEERMKEASIDVERAAAIRDLIHSWIAAGTITTQITGTPIAGTSANLDITNADGTPAIMQAVVSTAALNFTTTADNPARSPSATMRLFIDDDEVTPEVGLTLEYRASTTAPWRRMQLEPTITYLTIEFLDNVTGFWYEASQANGATARAVRITLAGSDDVYYPGILSLPIIQTMNPTAVNNPVAEEGAQ